MPIHSLDLPRVRRARRRLGPLLLRLLGLAQQRRQLRQLDRRLLEDIGLTPADAESEAARPVWDVPPHWRR